MLAPEFYPVWGGTGSYIIELVKFLPKNVNIHVITLRRYINEMSSKTVQKNLSSIIDREINVHYLTSSRETFFYNFPFQLACLKEIPKLHKKYGFDIIHSHLCHMPDIYLKLFKITQLPTVATIHSTMQMQTDNTLRAQSLWGNLEWSEKSSLYLAPILTFLQKKYVKNVPNFIAVAKITKKLAIEHLNLDPDHVSVVYNGVNTNLFRTLEKDEVDRKNSHPTVVYVGRIMAKKGVRVLIDSITQILQAVPQTRFVFVGGGNISMYEKIIAAKNIPQKNVSFIGHIGYFDRPQVLRDASVFVNPSLFENCSLSVLEAMSSETAVVASNVGGNPELINSGKNGLLIPPNNPKILANSVISLLENNDYNRQLGMEARKTVEERFSSKKNAYETCSLYRQMCAN